MKVTLKIRILNRKEEAFLGPGPVDLLKRIESTGSILRAAGEMEMSYMKALRLVNDIEANVGRKLVIRRAGGPGGGGSDLTSFARSLIDAYEQLEGRVLAYAKREFKGSLVGRVFGEAGETYAGR